MLQAYPYLKEESIIAMILIFKDDKENWHLVKALGKEGFASIGIISHCGNAEGGESVSQVPDKFIKMICSNCKVVVEAL
jgi:hypothetical protein